MGYQSARERTQASDTWVSILNTVLMANVSGLTFVSYAIEDEDMVTWLLNHGADPNRQYVINLTPFSFAVESAPISVIRLILSHGGDVQKGQLLHHAIKRQADTIDVLRLLLEQGTPINATMYEKHYSSRALFQFMGLGTALHEASALGKLM